MYFIIIYSHQERRLDTFHLRNLRRIHVARPSTKQAENVLDLAGIPDVCTPDPAPPAVAWPRQTNG